MKMRRFAAPLFVIPLATALLSATNGNVSSRRDAPTEMKSGDGQAVVSHLQLNRMPIGYRAPFGPKC